MLDLSTVLSDYLLKKEKRKALKEPGDSQYIYQNELDKVCF